MDKWIEENVHVFKGDTDYVMCLKHEYGGPIISDPDYESCKRKFIEAYRLCKAVHWLISMKEYLNNN